jgi:hypothetical protein
MFFGKNAKDLKTSTGWQMRDRLGRSHITKLPCVCCMFAADLMTVLAD